MTLDYETLKLTWWIFVGVLLIGFAITDGMDMGVGALLPFLGETDDERRVIINTIAPHWDGNQVWFVTAGGAIFAAWPAVYAAAFSGFYVAMLLVLFALFFRPVGFDYRSKIDDPRWRNAWDWGLFAGGAVPAFLFGVVFGNLLQGVPFQLDNLLRPSYEGGLLTLINPYGLLAGVISLSMLMTHGGLWLQMRTERRIAERTRRWIKISGFTCTGAFALGGIWLWLGIDGYSITSMPATDAQPNPLNKEVAIQAGAWLENYSRYPLMMIAPLLGLGGMLAAVGLSSINRPGLGFAFSSLSMAGIILTAGFSMFPFIMPSSLDPVSSLTLWDASSSHLTLKVMFWATVIFLPLVISYTIWTYVKMWGRVSVGYIQENTHSAY